MATGLSFNIFGKDVSAGKAIKHVETQADESSSAIGEHFKKLGEVMAEAFAAEKIIEFGKSAFEAAEAAEKTSRQTEAVIKSTGGSAHITAEGIKELSHQIGSYAGMSDQSVQAGENMLLTFKNVRNEVGKGNDIFDQTSKTATDLAVSMGMQLPNAMRLVGRAVNDPVKGLSILTRYGITFTDQQKKQMAQLVATGHAMDAQKMVLAELNQKFAGSAAAQATPADKARAAWANLKVEIGDGLMPVVDALMNFIQQNVIPAISLAVHWIEQHKEGFVELGKVVLGIADAVYKNALLPIIKALIPVVQAIVRWIKAHQEGLKQTGEVILKVLVGAFKLAIEILKIAIGVIRDVVIVVAALVRAFISAARGVGNAVGDIGRFIDSIPRRLAAILGRIGSIARNIGLAIWRGIRDGVSQIADLGKEMYNAIASTLNNDLINPIKNWHFTIGAFGVHHTFQPFGSIPDIPLLAQGTGFFRSRSGLAVVGDAGPELVRLPTGAQVLNRQAAMSHLGGQTVIENHFHISGALSTDATIKRAVISALEHAVNSDGQHINIGKGIR